MSTIRQIYRTLLFLLLLIIGIFLTIIFLRNTMPTRGLTCKIALTWLGLLTKIFGVKIKHVGKALPEKTLFVSNHISWLDILVLGHLVPVHFLSKHEVKSMPVFGWLATRGGTLYIKRGNKHAATTAGSEITAVLKQNHNSLFFAEGTTSNGCIKKFHSRLFQSAIDAQAMVQPVAIFYPIRNNKTGNIEINPTSLFLGKTTIAESYNLIVRARSIDVEVHFLAPIDCTHKTRDEIANYTHHEVAKTIEKIKKRL